MKKSLAILSVVFSMLFLFSCSKDKDEPASIVGKWQLQSAVPNDDYGDCDYQGYFDIKANNTFEVYDKCEDETFSGTWTKNGNTVSVKEDGFPLSVDATILSLTNSTLVMQVPDLINGGTIKETYKRI
jgi:hypothetical protein